MLSVAALSSVLEPASRRTRCLRHRLEWVTKIMRRKSALESEQKTVLRQRRAAMARVWFWLIPCLAAILAYLRSFGYGFIFDDRRQIILNQQIQSWDYLPRLLTTHVWSQKAAETLIPQYRPLFSVWLLIVYSFAGATEWVWHAVSIALYALSVYLVYRLAEELLQDRLAAGIAVFVFAVHPIHIESVCWVSACNELLLGSLFAVSLLHFHKGLRLNAKPFWNRWTLLSLLAWMAALLTKESVLPVVAVFPYLAWRFTKQSSPFKERTQIVVHRAVPYIFAAMLYLAVRLAVLGKMGLGNGSHTWSQVVYSAPSLFAFYMQKLVVPTGLSGFYLNPLVSSPSTEMWMVAGLIVAGIVLLGWFSQRKDPAIGVGGILLLAPLLLVLIAVKVFLDGETAHDRYLFLPSVGLCLLVGIAVKRLLKMSKTAKAAVFVAILAVVVCFASLTEAQEGYYRDEKAYFGRALEINPGNVLIMDYLGDSYLRDARMPEALALFQRASNLAPQDANATYCLARGLYKDGQFAAAEPLLETLATAPGLTQSRRFMGRMLLVQDELRLEHPDRAEALLKQLASEEPNAAGVHYTLGSIYQVQGRLSEAQNEYLLEYKISGNSLSGEQALKLSRRLSTNRSSRGQSLPRPPETSDPEQLNGVE
jgi:protein O-mannosyl-transferase